MYKTLELCTFGLREWNSFIYYKNVIVHAAACMHPNHVGWFDVAGLKI
jgi:hypothetical protein